MKATVLLAGIWALLSCKANEPKITLLPGRWEFVEAISPEKNQTYKANPKYTTYVAFTGNGISGELPESYPFDGGWCNSAEKYMYVNNTLTLIFGAPQCIPLVPQKRDTSAKVIELTQDTLIIKWQYTTYRYRRA